jgi:ribonuclease-3
MDEGVRAHLESILGYRFKDELLFERAITHASVSESRLHSNERLEFLGDSVLGLVTCELIFRHFPNFLEGEMTKIKSAVVSRQTCSEIAKRLGLESLLVLGKGMQKGVELPQSLGAAALEAVIGAVFLDGGYEAAAAFIRPLVEPLVHQFALSGHQQNFKSVLQQHAQQAMDSTPCYRILDEQGPDHAKCFKICVEIGARRFEPSWGQSKKRAEQLAALNALRELGVIEDLGNGHVRLAPVVVPAESNTPALVSANRVESNGSESVK